MTKLIYRGVAVLVCLASLFILFACASQSPMDTEAAEVETWQVEITGQTVGKLKLTLKRYPPHNNSQSFKGKLFGPIKDDWAGLGNADYRLKGKITNGEFTCRIGGYSNMTAGSSSVSGGMRGKIRDSRGSGTWRVVHGLGTSSGRFTMKKVASSQ